jgi:hypothetical protein
MTQPAIKSATIADRNLGSNSYYKVNQDGKATMVSDTAYTIVDGGTAYYQHNTKYNYSQTHDSIVKSYTYGGSYTELELPLLLKYKLSHDFSVYGGVNILYSRVTAITEHTYTNQGILKSVESTNTAIGTSPAPASPVSDKITYSGNPYSEYNGPLTTATQGGVRAGYMLGFSYSYTERWLLDALVEQSPMKQDIKGTYNLNTPLSLPYFRLSVGYKITR